MGQAKDLAEQIMSWIETNYYQGMYEKLTAEGFTCESQVESPWYTTDCPRSKAMKLHNEVFDQLAIDLKKDKSLGSVISAGVRLVLSQKHFSEREIFKQQELDDSLAMAATKKG